MSNNIFAVIKFYRTFGEERSICWEKIYSPTRYTELTSREAREIIEQNAMKKVFESRDGVVYEKEGQPFRNKFRKYKIPYL